MRAVDVPVADRARLIGVEAQVRDRLGPAHSARKVQIGRSIVDRIRIENDQPVDFAGVQIGDQLLQIVHLHRWHRMHGLGIDHRFADIAKRLIDGMRGHVNGGRGLLAGDHDTLAGVRLQILHRGIQKRRLLRRPLHGAGASGSRRTHRLCQRSRKGIDLAGAQRQPMIGLKSSGGRRAFYRIQPVHGNARLQRTAAGIVGRELQKSRVPEAGEKLRVQRNNHVCLVQLVLRIDKLPKHLLGGDACRVPIDGLILHPLGIGVVGAGLFPLPGQRGRQHGGAEKIQPLPAARFLVLQHLGKVSREIGKIACLAAI